MISDKDCLNHNVTALTAVLRSLGRTVGSLWCCSMTWGPLHLADIYGNGSRITVGLPRARIASMHMWHIGYECVDLSVGDSDLLRKSMEDHLEEHCSACQQSMLLTADFEEVMSRRCCFYWETQHAYSHVLAIHIRLSIYKGWWWMYETETWLVGFQVTRGESKNSSQNVCRIQEF